MCVCVFLAYFFFVCCVCVCVRACLRAPVCVCGGFMQAEQRQAMQLLAQQWKDDKVPMSHQTALRTYICVYIICVYESCNTNIRVL